VDVHPVIAAGVAWYDHRASRRRAGHRDVGSPTYGYNLGPVGCVRLLVLPAGQDGADQGPQPCALAPPRFRVVNCVSCSCRWPRISSAV
jgi:hypothetical protein